MPIKNEKLMTTTVRNLPVSLHRAAKMTALQQDITMQDLIVRAIEAYVNQAEKRDNHDDGAK